MRHPATVCESPRSLLASIGSIAPHTGFRQSGPRCVPARQLVSFSWASLRSPCPLARTCWGSTTSPSMTIREDTRGQQRRCRAGPCLRRPLPVRLASTLRVVLRRRRVV